MQKIIIFNSARDVVRAERLCKESAIQVKVMPLPEHLSSECGMCLYVAAEDAKQVQELMKVANINMKIHKNG